MNVRLALSRVDSYRQLFAADDTVDWRGGNALRRLPSKSNPRSRTPDQSSRTFEVEPSTTSRVELSNILHGTSADHAGA